MLDLHNQTPLLAIVPVNEISEGDKFYFHPVSSRGLQKIVMSLPSSKAPGQSANVCTYKDALFHVFFQFLQLLKTVPY